MSGTNRENLRLLLAARLSRKTGKFQSIGIETQDEYGRQWAERQGHTIIGVAADHKSGRVAPWDRPNLRPWVTDPRRMAQYDAILAFKNDRLSRGDWDDEARIRQWASANGKMLIIVDGPQWPPRHEGDRWAWEAAAMQANKEWEEIQERILRFQRKLRADGKLVGATCFGYDIAGKQYDKTLAPNAFGRRYVPEMFQRIADGQSLSQVAAWLNAEHIKAKLWSPKTVSQIIHNRTYMGQRMDQKGQVVLNVEPLVDARLWKRANDRLANAPKGRRRPVSDRPAWMSGVLICDRCRAPMYRIKAWQGVFYRCAGTYPERKGCGHMVNLALADFWFVQCLALSDDPWKENQLIEGENHDIELADVELRLHDLPRRNLSDVDEDAERAKLRAERDRLIELNKGARPDEWREVELCGVCDVEYAEACDAADHPKMTVGQHWARLDYEGQRALVLERVKVYAMPSGPECPDPRLRIDSSGLFRPHVIALTWAEPTKAP